MARRRVLPARVRVCPTGCTKGNADAQHPLSEEEFRLLPDSAQAQVRSSGAPCYICDWCGTLYIREPYLDIPLGKLAVEGSRDVSAMPAPGAPVTKAAT